jgi:hypothetical protein
MTRIGINYEEPIAALIAGAAARGLVSGIEIIPDSYAYDGGVGELRQLIARYDLPCAFHFIDLSLGSADFATENRLSAYAAMVRQIDPVHCSDHLTCCRAGAIDLRQNLGVPRTPEMVEIFAENIQRTRRRFGASRRLLIENIASHWEFAESTLGPTAFYRAVLERSGAFALVDVHNLYVDELNFGIDAAAAIDQIPAERIAEVHVSGGSWSGNRATYIDSHDTRIPPRVFELLAHVLGRCRPDWVVFERLTRERERELDQISKEILEDLITMNGLVEQWTKQRAPRSRRSSAAG